MTPNTIRQMLRNAGLEQYTSGNSRSINNAGFGDFSVRFETNTTFARRRNGRRTRQTSTRTGNVEVVFRGRNQEQSQSVGVRVLQDAGLSLDVCANRVTVLND